MILDSRKDYNEKYYDLVGNGKRNFWKQVSTKINLQFGTSYSGAHCMEKFESLKRDYKVSRNSLVPFFRQYTTYTVLPDIKLIYSG